MADGNVTVCAHCGAAVNRKPSTCRDGRPAERVFCDRSCYDGYRAAIVALRRTAECGNCRKSFIGTTSDTKYCCFACRTEAKRVKPKHCVNCGCWFSPVRPQSTWGGKFVGYSHAKTCSAYCANQWVRNDPERKRKIGEAFRGDKHPNWQGGKSLLNNISGRGSNWPAQRAKALKRDGFCCVDCGMSDDECRAKWGRGLDVDHESPFHNFGSYRKANALSNLRSRCASCHRVAEAKRGMVQMVLPMQDGEKRSHKGYARGERHPRAKLSTAQVIDIRRRAKVGERLAEIGERYRMPAGHIHAIVTRVIWKSVP